MKDCHQHSFSTKMASDKQHILKKLICLFVTRNQVLWDKGKKPHFVEFAPFYSWPLLICAASESLPLPCCICHCLTFSLSEKHLSALPSWLTGPASRIGNDTYQNHILVMVQLLRDARAQIKMQTGPRAKVNSMDSI